MMKVKLFLVFVLFAGTIGAYEYGDDERPCEKHRCSIPMHPDVRCWMQGGNQNIYYMNPSDGGSHSIPNACMRSNIFGGDGYLAAYPSIGGLVFLRNPLAVDFQYLGLPNTHDTARSPDEDDELATRMVQLGAQWWPGWDLYLRHSSRIDDGVFYDYHFPSKVDVAFPTTGGVWVANFTRDASKYQYVDKFCQPWLPHPQDMWRVKMRYVLTMNDKAGIMEDLGGTFYTSVDEAPGLAKTVHESIDLFEPFRERLSNMEDAAYRGRFCAGYEYENGDRAAGNLEKPRWGIWSLLNQLH